MSALKIEVGGQYRTRGGWRAVVVDRDGSETTTTPWFLWHANGDETWWHHSNGSFDDKGEDRHDLIAEWTDPPERKPVPTVDEWGNVYPDGMRLARYGTREQADLSARMDRIGILHLHGPADNLTVEYIDLQEGAEG